MLADGRTRDITEREPISSFDGDYCMVGVFHQYIGLYMRKSTDSSWKYKSNVCVCEYMQSRNLNVVCSIYCENIVPECYSQE